METYDIRSMTLEEIEALMVTLGEPKFRAKQIYEWLHKKLVQSLDEMTNIPLALREKIKQEVGFAAVEEETKSVSKIDGTTKFLFKLQDGSMVESVLMKYKHGNSVCISSQVGCRMGCRFCASTIGGLTSNLLPSEML